MCRKTGSDCRKWVPLFSPSPARSLRGIAPSLGQPSLGTMEHPQPQLSQPFIWAHSHEISASLSGKQQQVWPLQSIAGREADVQRLVERLLTLAAIARALQVQWRARRLGEDPTSLLLKKRPHLSSSPPATQWPGWYIPYFCPLQTLSRCPGSQWGSQHPVWLPPSSPGTVAFGLAAAAAGC